MTKVDEAKKAADDVEEASMESFPASDAPASRHGALISPGQTSRAGKHQDDTSQSDEQFWRDAILQRGFYKPEVGFDRYRWALHFGQMARKHHKHDATFETAIADLESGWKEYGGPSGLSWEEAREAVQASWEHTGTLLAEAVAGRAGFKRPPTFSEHGSVVPRNIDEPNG
jgi:hypothetical protein